MLYPFDLFLALSYSGNLQGRPKAKLKAMCIVQGGNTWKIVLINVDWCDITLSNTGDCTVVELFGQSLWSYGKHNEAPEELLTPNKKHTRLRVG